MGERLQGSNRIYCVVRPERPLGARVQRGVNVFFENFYSLEPIAKLGI